MSQVCGNEAVNRAYERIRDLYRGRGRLHAFYFFFRNFSCPIRKIFTLIPAGSRYIDVGCGFGFISHWTALVFPAAQVLGLDLVPSRIAFARELAAEAGITNVSFATADITRDPIEPAEIILLIDLFHHIPFAEQLPFLKQCIDKTPAGGFIVFKDIDRRPWWKFRVNYLQDLLFSRSPTYSRHQDEYMAFFRENGMKAEYFDLKQGFPYAHYLIRAQKVH
jgi:SAM-dependent methyltransferase